MIPPSRKTVPKGRARAGELIAALLLVGAIVAATHWPVLRAQALSFDDNDFVTYNPLVSHPSWTSAARFFGEVLNPSTVKGYYLPLSMASLMLDYAAGGRPGNLGAFHRTNLALHVAATLLLVLLLYRLFGALVPAAIAGLLFGLHPLTVEPVAWIGERKTLLAAGFAFASLAAYAEHCRRRGRAGRAWLPASVGLYFLALLSKPTVTPLPLLLLALDWWPLARLDWRAVREKWAFFALALASAAVTVISHERTAGIAEAPQSSLLHWPLKAAYLLAFYLEKIVRPVNLSCTYASPTQWTPADPVILISLLVVVGLSVALVVLARRVRGPLAGWLFFVLALAPTLGLVKYSWVIASDKYVYFAAPGILLVLASGIAVAWRSPRLRQPALRGAFIVLVLAVCVAEARGVRATLAHWTDTLTLYRYMEKLTPDAPVVQCELGVLLQERSAPVEATRHLRRALELAPGYTNAHYNLGIVLGSRGQIEEAVSEFRTADRLLPDDPPTVYNLGAALRLAGKLDEAEAQLRRALRLKPDLPEALNLLGGILVSRGRVAEAVEQFRAAVALAPADPNLRFRLAMALVGQGGHAAEAADQLRQIVRAKPEWPEPFNALAWLLATSPDPAIRRPEEALPLAARAAELTGRRDPRVLDTLGAAQAAAGQFTTASATAREALALASGARADALAAEIRQHLAAYARGVAYTEDPTLGAGPAPRPTP